MIPIPFNIIYLYINDDLKLILEVSPWIYIPFFIVTLIITIRSLWKIRKRFNPVRLNIKLGGIGNVELSPSFEDIDIAHKIWTELVTRKAALPFDEENDVIVEIYDSWYTMFGRIRSLISEIPAHLIRNDKDTKKLVRIAIGSLNLGLRPHLTKWQARFRNWYSLQTDELKHRSPQELQKNYPQYNELITDLIEVNNNLIQYAEELQKISQGV